jgi:DNA-binding PadR family transcriptional regulator
MGKPRNKTQELQDKGRESRQRVLDYFAEMMRATNNPIDADQMRELTATWLYFPEGRKLAEKIDALYGDKPELHRAELLGAIIALINRLLA